LDFHLSDVDETGQSDGLDDGNRQKLLRVIGSCCTEQQPREERREALKEKQERTAIVVVGPVFPGSLCWTR
jgi:hypothetical protein